MKHLEPKVINAYLESLKNNALIYAVGLPPHINILIEESRLKLDDKLNSFLCQIDLMGIPDWHIVLGSQMKANHLNIASELVNCRISVHLA